MSCEIHPPPGVEQVGTTRGPTLLSTTVGGLPGPGLAQQFIGALGGDLTPSDRDSGGDMRVVLPAEKAS